MSDDALREPEEQWDGKTFGAAAAQDEEQADEVLAETGDPEAAEERFDSSEDEVGETPTS